MTTATARTVEYPADGLTMVGHLALPSGVGRRPAVLIGPEGPGLYGPASGPKTRSCRPRNETP